MKRFLLAFLLLAATASAQETERVTVHGGSLSGFWRIEAAAGVRINLLGTVTWAPLRPVWCRLAQGTDGFSTHCFASTSKGGWLEQDGRHFHSVSDSGQLQLSFDGEVTSATSRQGHYSIKVMGFPVSNPTLAHSTKFVPRPDAPDEAGKAQVVRSVLNGDAVAHDAALDADIAAARGLKLGAIRSVSFLGRQFLPGKAAPKAAASDPNYLAAYAVEFADGEALCWLHQDDDGKLAAFRCA
jgi:hypothetical protein